MIAKKQNHDHMYHFPLSLPLYGIISLCFSTTNLDKARTSNKNALDDWKIKSENKWEGVNVQQ